MLASIFQNQNQTPIPPRKTHPRDLADSPLRPASDVERKDTGQNLALIYFHQEGLAHGVDNENTRWAIHRENSFFLTYNLKFLVAPQLRIQY
jgi:hypothetical protein